MLEIFNNLQWFFEDCYAEFGVREYARIANVSPPTASTRLSQYEAEGFLTKTTQRKAILYQANRENKYFFDLSRMYWRYKLESLTAELTKTFVIPTIILFGSLAKVETTKQSDIDIAIIAPKKHFDLEKYEKKLKRQIHLLNFEDFSTIPKDLLHNIISGYVLHGKLKWTGELAVKNKS